MDNAPWLTCCILVVCWAYEFCLRLYLERRVRVYQERYLEHVGLLHERIRSLQEHVECLKQIIKTKEVPS